MTFKRYFQIAIFSLVGASLAFYYLYNKGFTQITHKTEITALNKQYNVSSYIQNRISQPIYGVVTINDKTVFMCNGSTEITSSFNVEDSTLIITTNGDLSSKSDKVRLEKFKDITIKYIQH